MVRRRRDLSGDLTSTRTPAPLIGRIARHGIGVLFAAWLFLFAWRFGLLRAIQENHFMAISDAGIGLLCLWRAPRWQVVVCLIAGIFIQLGGAHHHLPFAVNLIATLGTAGVCSICVLVYTIVSGDSCPVLRRTLRPALIFWVFGAFLTQMLILLTKAIPMRYDLSIYAIDCVIAPGAAGALAKAVTGTDWVFNVESAVYDSLGAAMVIVYCAYFYYPRERQLNPLPAYVLGSLIGYPLYFLVPAAGPAYAFHQSFPNLPGLSDMTLNVTPGAGVPNAMPSLHFASALLVYFNSHQRWLRAFSLAFLALTAIATVGLGEHYVTDLVVAVPFAVFVQCLAARRNTPLMAGSAFLVGAWLWLILMLGPGGRPSGIVCWSLTIASIMTAAFLGPAESKPGR